MTETEQLIARLHSLAERMGRAPSTISAKVLGGGQVLSDLESGKTITLAKYQRAKVLLDRLEAEASQGRAA